MINLPKQLISGKQSRLFSSLKLSNKELIARAPKPIANNPLEGHEE
tara:strand:- start:748 stop:885 length:138 start_codon:yes stop_codon:yes gene_type:complete